MNMPGQAEWLRVSRLNTNEVNVSENFEADFHSNKERFDSLFFPFSKFTNGRLDCRSIGFQFRFFRLGLLKFGLH